MKRLEAIVSLFGPCEVFADIGSDHGFIAQSALSFAKKVIVTDISEKCLDKARNLLKDCANVEFSAGDGLKALGGQIDAVDCMAICGMGGHTVCGILEGYTGRARIIIQPQNDVNFVRKFLAERNFVILHDFLAYERGKFYDIIECVKNGAGLAEQSENLSQLQLNFGKFYKERNELGKKRLTLIKKKYESYPPTEKNAAYLNLIKEALEYQNGN